MDVSVRHFFKTIKAANCNFCIYIAIRKDVKPNINLLL